MAQLLVRKLEASVVRRLRARAAREGISAEEAHRRILRESLAPGEAVVRADGLAIVRANDGAVELLRGRIEDDDGERELDARGLANLVHVG